jgi:MraZ protein
LVVFGESRGFMADDAPETTATEVSLGFTGNHTVRMDSALRAAVPVRFKEVLDKKYGAASNQVVLVPDSGKVKVLPLPVWQTVQKKLEELSEFDPSADEYRTFIFGNMAVCQLDAQNRIRLTPSLCELAELQKELVVVGQQDRMEIWDAAKWKEFNAGTAKNFKAVMAEVFRNRQASGVK